MKIGIALGGGGAKGFAHVGVLKALAKAGIECHVVSGTSIGALVGAVYATGNLEKLEEASTRIKLKDVPFLLGPTWSRQGFFSGRRILKFLNDHIEVENIEDLKKPFAAVCVDLEDGEIVTLREGSLRQAIRASISIPAVFTPITYKGKILVDGGALEPVPVEAARSLGADFVIAVDLLAHSRPSTAEENPVQPVQEISYTRSTWLKRHFKLKEKEPGILSIIQKTSIIAQRGLTKYRLKEYPPDFIIRPDVSQIGFMDFHRGAQTVMIGEQATRGIMPELIEIIDKIKEAADSK